MALPLLALLGLGSGILGGASYLFGKSNKRQAEGEYAALESGVANSPWAGTPAGFSLLQNAQEDMNNAGFMDWATGEPNNSIGRARDGLTSLMFQQQQSQQVAANAQALQEAQWWRDSGKAREAEIRTDWQAASEPHRLKQRAAFDLQDALETGDGASKLAVVQRLGQLLEMGIITDAEAKSITGTGGARGLIESITGELFAGGQMSPTAQGQLKRLAHTLAVNSQEALQRERAGFDTQVERARKRYGTNWDIQDPYVFGTVFDDSYIPELTPQDIANANLGRGGGGSPGPNPTSTGDPNFDADREAHANSMGLTTIAPPRRNNPSVRDMRGR